MSFIRRFDGSSDRSTDTGIRPTPVHEQQRRAIQTGLVSTGTLACARCDAPVAVGEVPLAITDVLMCPFCEHTGTVRDFLTLGQPTRPARVAIKVRLPRQP